MEFPHQSSMTINLMSQVLINPFWQVTETTRSGRQGNKLLNSSNIADLM